jgi:hypothetical protein
VAQATKKGMPVSITILSALLEAAAKKHMGLE